MNKVKIYEAENEPVLGYKKGSKERLNVEKTYNEMFNSKVDIPLYIGSHDNDLKYLISFGAHKILSRLLV